MNANSSSFFIFVSVLLSLFTSSCDSRAHPKIVKVSSDHSFRPIKPIEVHTPEQALTLVLTISGQALPIPVVDPVYLYLHENTSSVASYWGDWKTLPTDVADVTAFARNTDIHVNLETVREMPSASVVWLLAHEYSHLLQQALAGGPHLTTTTWFSEGFSEWLAASLFDYLGWQSFDASRHRAIKEITRNRDALPDLSLLRDNRMWRYLAGKSKGYVNTYTLAFLAVDKIIQDKGLSAVLQYLGSGDFRRSFDMDLAGFLSEFAQWRSQIRSQKVKKFRVEKPEWRIGCRWVYEERSPGRTSTITKRVLGQDAFRGTPSITVTLNENRAIYSKDTLALMGIMTNGNVVLDLNKPNELISWPLHSGKEWRNSYIEKNVQRNHTRRYDRSMHVSASEQITVGAGKFAALRIDGYGFRSGRLWAEYWYSPEAKWFIKVRTYSPDDGLVEKELIEISGCS